MASKQYSWLIAGLLLAASAQAQTPEPSVLYSGRVQNPMAAPLAGASVLVKGTAVVTTTNSEGVFRFRGPTGPQVLVVSYPRHLTVQYPISSPDSVVITLHSTQPRATPRRPE
ncbi:carboxypeptidase regulatory-like domain-containing protein [Hymenobacter endophyticus]|uniref:Carboxypeptidase-like regulatory domain-containing protein n=1 Tax=Hymenobacter endophyticus TaxID=3076335 RepID=A0ABU3TE46_9BACT|nr:carboxypeptidase regulatory-like domain-containing protein [Hymenobacter endophyticus]MDU0369652.1 carboxypeptidase-like regulatory domain-containing protein [Hymenobacter endophyticus]